MRRGFHKNKYFSAFAVQLGYKILKIHEAWVLKKQAQIFEDFYKILASVKIKASGFPPELFSHEEKERYCEKTNLQMGFYRKGELELASDNVIYNEPLRQASKLAQNAIFGKKLLQSSLH